VWPFTLEVTVHHTAVGLHDNPALPSEYRVYLVDLGEFPAKLFLLDQRQLLFPIGDNYFSLRTTFTAINC